MGSESKLFTAVVLAQLVEAKGVGLTQNLQSILPTGVTAPSRDNIQIELRDLATHHSGLPDMPTNVDQNSAQQRADYSDAKLWQFLAGYSLPWDPGNKGTWLYSNLGFGLLGTALALHEGTDFNTLLQRVTGPLGMTQTRVQTERTPPIPGMAQGYSSGKSKPPNQPVAFYNFMQPLVGGGGLLSSINDMGAFVAANLGFNPSSVTPALLLTLQPMAPGPVPKGNNAPMTMGLAWQLSTSRALGVPIAYKNGATSGFKSATVLLPEQHIGITILSNGPVDPSAPMMAVAKALLS
jgi:CubicO group peptidase (beta-lactamase class C family)